MFPLGSSWNGGNNRWEGVETESTSNESQQSDYSAWWNAFTKWVTDYLNSDNDEE